MIPLVLQAAAGKRDHVSVFGTDYDTPDGTAVRDYIHIEDLGEAHILGLERATEPGRAPHLQPRQRHRLLGPPGDRGRARRHRPRDPGQGGGPPPGRPGRARGLLAADPRRAGLGPAQARDRDDDRGRLGVVPGARPQGLRRPDALARPFCLRASFIYASNASRTPLKSADSSRNARVCAFPPCFEPFSPTPPPGRSPRSTVLAILLPVGLGSSQAAFVAQSTNPNQVFSRRLELQHRRGHAHRPGHAAARHRDAQRGRHLRPRHQLRRLPDLARRREHVDDRLHRQAAALQLQLGTRPTVTDGLRDIRAVATDNAGYTKTATVTNRRVDNTAPTADHHRSGLAADRHRLGLRLRRRRRLRRGEHDAPVPPLRRRQLDRHLHRRRPRSSPARGTRRRSPTASTTCAPPPTDVAGNTGTSAVVTNRRLDNIAPTATMTAPAANLTGSVTLASTSADGANGTGVASVRYEYKLSSGSTWATACTGLTTPFSCSFDTAHGRRRPLRLPRRRDRRRRQDRHLGRGHLAPDRQHRPDGDDGRARRQPLRLGVARPRRPPTPAPASPRSSTSTSSPPARRGRTPARPRPRPTPARSTPPR